METIRNFLESLATLLDDQPELKGGLTLASLGVSGLAMLRWAWGLLRPARRGPQEPSLSVKVESGDVDIQIGGR